MQTGVEGVFFQVHPSVVYRLGRELISDEIMALVELIKNCYDADASYAKFVINTNDKCPSANTAFPNAKGYITVEDDGFGMSLEAIRRGWLTISDSTKIGAKQNKIATPKKRTPIGDKGLGRLGAQRLGDNIEIFTRPANESSEYHVAFSWSDFTDARAIENVPVTVERGSFGRTKGTLLLISGLHPNQFAGSLTNGDIPLELSRLISPYKPPSDFQVVGDINGRKVSLSELTSRLLNVAELRYSIAFEGTQLSVSGKVKLEFLNQGTKKTNANFEKFALEDHGSALWNYIAEKKETLAYGLKKSANKSWFLEFSKNFKLSEIDKHEEVKGSPIQPGPFEGEIYSVKKNLSSQAAKEVFSSASELRKVIRESAGVRIYRDGFGVRVDWDWLRLGKRWTSGGSYYSLKPDNTIGHIDISASHNPMLVEMTDREGFVKNKEYDAFVLLMQTFLAYSEAVQEFLRREWTKFVQANTLNERSVGENETPESLVDSLEKTFAAAKTVSQPIGELMSVLDEELSNISEVLPKELSSIKADERSSRRLLAIANRLQPLQKRADKVLGSVAEYLDEVIALAPKGIVIKNHLSAFDRQLSQMYDTVALGLTAEALSHEVYQVADRLAERASLLERQMKDSTVSDVSLRAFVEHVNSSVIALRKQISHLSPSLRYVRERKETIHVKAFAKEFGSFYRERLREKKIRIEVDEGNSQDFTVRINGGKLTQVLDNLTLNSEYWLSEDIRLGRLEDGRIKIAVVPPLIRFSDNGRGIDPSIESLLFQPFITTKAKGRGRGLGLFISKQLLESDGCEIKVSSRRNSAGRLYVFEVELEGAQIE